MFLLKKIIKKVFSFCLIELFYKMSIKHPCFIKQKSFWKITEQILLMLQCLQLLSSVILQWVCTKGHNSTNIMPPWRQFTGQRVTASINHEWLCVVTKYLGDSLQHAAGSLLLREEQIGANAEQSRELGGAGAGAGAAQDGSSSSSSAAALGGNRSWC